VDQINGFNLTAIIRHNTKVSTDLKLAEKEIRALTGENPIMLESRQDLVNRVGDLRGLNEVKLPDKLSTVGFGLDNLGVSELFSVVYRSSFVQEAIIRSGDEKINHLTEILNVPLHYENDLIKSILIVPSLCYLVESESVYRPSNGVQDRLAGVGKLLLAPFIGNPSSESRRVRGAIKTTLSLTHDIHVYKAKFFPRMVRSLLNMYGAKGGICVDPFCGSGTALLEASLLGMKGVGIDIDPVSKLISSSKVNPFFSPDKLLDDLDLLEEEVRKAEDCGALDGDGFPEELEGKIRRQDAKNDTNFLPEVKRDVEIVRKAISARSWNTPVPETLASDAVTKKVRYRFVGVGNGSYTVNVLKTRLIDRLLSKIDRVREILDSLDSISRRVPWELGGADAALQDSVSEDTWKKYDGLDLIITSPPYLPASSGREHYSKSRALSYYVLGKEAPDTSSLVEYDSTDALEQMDLSHFREAQRLLDFLKADKGEGNPSRDAMRYERKYFPTKSYIININRFLLSACRSMNDGAKLIMVVSNSHVFYESKSRSVEFEVDCEEMYTEFALRAGLSLRESIRLQLYKPGNTNAKPRSKDDYSEVVLVFEKT